MGVFGMSFQLSLQHSTDPFCPNSTPNPSVKTQFHQFWSIHGYTVYPDPNIRVDWSITFHDIPAISPGLLVELPLFRVTYALGQAWMGSVLFLLKVGKEYGN